VRDKEKNKERDKSLTEAVLRYQKSGEGKKAVVDEAALRAYRIAHMKRDWDDDDAGEFFCSFLPKIPELVDRYRDNGSSFEVFLHVHLLWSIRGYAKKLKRRRYESTLNTYDTFWEVHEERPEDAMTKNPSIPMEIRETYKIDEIGSITSTMWKQRFIFLILRESEYLDNSLVESIVSATGVNRKWLMNCVVSLRERIERRRKRLETLRRKRNYWFYRYQLLQVRLTDTYEPEERDELFGQLKYLRERYLRASERVQDLHTHPTNLDISQVLNIPKGSIDSGIHYIMSRYRSMEEEQRWRREPPEWEEPRAA